MRKILFRAIAKGDLKTMVHGYYHYDSQTDTHYICLKDSLIRKEIDPDTLGQFTGLTDKNGVEIYENDILQLANGEIVKASFKAGKFVGIRKNGEVSLSSFYWIYASIIGNLHENPELL